MSIDYKPRIQVLFVENDDKIAKSFCGELFRRNIFVFHTTNLKSATEALKEAEVEIVISDGMFPARAGKTEQKNFIPLVHEVRRYRKTAKIIAWSNATHVHEYCKKNKIENYSKVPLTKTRFTLRGRKYIPVKRLTSSQLADVVEERFIDEINFKKITHNLRFESYYKEPATVLALFLAADTRTGLFKKTAGLNYGPMINEMDNRVFNMTVDLQNDKKVALSIYRKFYKKGYFETVYKILMKRAGSLLDFSNRLRKANYQKLSNNRLATFYLRFCNLFEQMRMYSSLPTALEHGSSTWTDTLKKILNKKIKNTDEANKVFSVLTTPEKNSYVKDFELELSHLALMKAKHNPITKEIASILERYVWINYTFEGKPLTRLEVKERIDKLINNEGQVQLKGQRVRESKKKIYEKYNFSSEEKRFFQIGSDIVFIKFYRKGVFAQSYYSVEFLLREIGNRIGCTGRQVINMLPEEVLAGLKLGLFPGRLIEERLKGSVLFHNNGKTYPLGVKAKKYYKVHEEKKKSEKSINGQTAYFGKHSGRVKIVNAISEVNKVRKGDIMISRSTNPTLFPAMQKSGAIVTDIGGLTCHAAIVARELKKPCIVGTKNATKVFKDGDLVEVDANRGVVRKL